MSPILFRHRVAAAMVLLAASVASAQAQEHRASSAPVPPKYRQECGACHVPYPAGLLPAASWQRLMNDLPHHFGSDASLDAAATKELSAYLAANAGSDRRMREQPPQDRITRSAWFVRQHDELPAPAWRSPAVKTPANCTACHQQAIQGDFDEDRVRIPR